MPTPVSPLLPAPQEVVATGPFSHTARHLYHRGCGVPRQRANAAQPPWAQQAAQGSWRAGASSRMPWQPACCRAVGADGSAQRSKAPWPRGRSGAQRWARGPGGGCVGGHGPVLRSGHGQRGELAPCQRAFSPTQAASGPAACYRELSRFPAITRAALGAAAGGQTFLLYTGELWARPSRRFWPTGPAQAVADGPLPQSAAAPTCPVAGSCASAATTACGARAAATSPSVGQRSVPRSTTSTARTGCGVGQHGRCPWRGRCLWHGRCQQRATNCSLPPSCPQAPEPGFTHGAAPCRAQPLPTAGPRAAGGNAGCPVTAASGLTGAAGVPAPGATAMVCWC